MPEVAQVPGSRNEVGIDYENGFGVIWALPPFAWKRNAIKTPAIVDIDDVELVKTFRWKIRGAYIYSVKKKGYGSVFLHRLVMRIANGDSRVVDHINRIPSDCRKANLRICTQSQNCWNRIRRDNKSGFSGVSWHEANKKWRAAIALKGRKFVLGHFKKREDAAVAVDIANRIRGSQFAILNFPNLDHTTELIERIASIKGARLFRSRLEEIKEIAD